MGLITSETEITTAIPAARLFKAFVTDGDTLIPKIAPQAFKSFGILEGDGGPGTIKQIQMGEGPGVPSKSVKTRVDATDAEKFTHKYTLLEGDLLNEKIESISYEMEFAPGPDGGTIGKIKATYVTKGEGPPTEEERKKGKETSLAMFKVVEGYLQQNPDAYV
ncbi:unnamed protein product [Linum tenue]|uniref:Bet v I/Major latex protein domain-containing protein n=1 Tax=Linum tenue TaxID=586396 RepID=A0AAV0P848_9ROSI|nr:unnamed protein product [Linum tenue]